MSERALLLAVQQKLQSLDDFKKAEVAIEPDEMAPSITGELYVAVMPGGWSAGPVHKTSGHVDDELFTVEVSVIIRLPKTPRDKTRKVFIDHLGSLNKYLSLVKKAINYRQDVRLAANTIIMAEEGPGLDGFMLPLKWVRNDPKPRVVSAELYAGAKEDRAGLARRAYFETRRIDADTYE